VYLRVVERRAGWAAPTAWVDVSFDPPVRIPDTTPRFKPRRVPVAEIEAISAIAPPRAIRVEHGPVKVSNLAPSGFARLLPGQEVRMPARAAAALVLSGCAVYTDTEAAEVAA
jgi:hypothetical protein